MSRIRYAVKNNFRMFPTPQHGRLDDGINCGVALMRLNRWRKAFPNYLEQVNQGYAEYGEYFVFPTQDLFNVWLGTHRRHYYEHPCEWNVRPTILKLKTRVEWRSSRHLGRPAFVKGAKALHAAGGRFTDGTPGWSDVLSSFENTTWQPISWQT